MSATQIKVGILGLQGNFLEHMNALSKFNVDSIKVIRKEDLRLIDALIIPGGESTTISTIALSMDLMDSIKALISSKKPVWGTCAGLIMLSEFIDCNSKIKTFGGLSVIVQRNYFGSQLNSAIRTVNIHDKDLGKDQIKAIFIRAPVIKSILNSPLTSIKILGTLESGEIVAVRQGNILATCFHPELSDDDTVFHEYFFKMIKESK
ncbi:pyridoxine biosynthesis glutamine amidotransferase [Rozella allomycis CSF55]|uniref:glutaminase n=1 Tax=Rozella allomycis (strain CSF55) TaxID=988480 RepID=A0A4P9YF21_ROZAC|nr:pyridoxine biosynthesis glutamine amidotransferase [Rozella allomycis CSF55]